MREIKGERLERKIKRFSPSDVPRQQQDLRVDGRVWKGTMTT